MGFVQLSDDLSSWEWFDDKNTVYVYLWLTLRAAWCATRYHGIELERGQVRRAAIRFPCATATTRRGGIFYGIWSLESQIAADPSNFAFKAAIVRW